MKKEAPKKTTMDSIRDPLDNYSDVMDDYLGITKDLGISDENEIVSPQKTKRHTPEDLQQATRAIRVNLQTHKQLKRIKYAYSQIGEEVSFGDIVEILLNEGIQSLPTEVQKIYNALSQL